MSKSTTILSKSTRAKFLQFFATVCLGPISLGATIGWTSPVLPQLLEDNNSTNPFHITNSEGSWVGSMLAIGCLSAAIPGGFLADRFGPKKCTIFFALPVIIFTIIVLFASDVYALCIARFIAGITTGGVSTIAPIYISEISDVALRGTLGSFFEFLIYVGIVMTAIFGAYVHYKTLTIIIGGQALLLGIAFFFLPESPTYLMRTNKRAKAKAALTFYMVRNYNVEEKLDQISDGLLKKSQDQKVSMIEMLQKKSTLRGLVACAGLTSFQQLSGIDSIVFYTVQIFQEAGTNMDAYTSAIVIALVQVVSAVLVVAVVEKADRKVFLYFSSLGMCVCLVFLGVYFHLKLVGVSFVGMSAIPLASLIIYTLFFALGLGPIPWMINGELFSPEIKGLANGITISSNWMFLFIITKSFPIMLKDVGAHYTFYTYAAFMIACAVFVKFCIPETRGKTLEEIQLELNA